MVLPPNHLIVFWAARPHGPIETAPGGWAHTIHLPLAWVLQWRLPQALMHPLLAGQVLLDPPGSCPFADLEMMKNWIGLMRQGSGEAQRIVLLEAEARLRRFGGGFGLANTKANGGGRSVAAVARHARPIRADGHADRRPLCRAADGQGYCRSGSHAAGLRNAPVSQV